MWRKVATDKLIGVLSNVVISSGTAITNRLHPKLGAKIKYMEVSQEVIQGNKQFHS